MEFKFKSSFSKYALWIILLLILTLDIYGLWFLFFQGSASVAWYLKAIALAGAGLRLGILYCLIAKHGPIKGLVSIWGGLFIISGATGLLSIILTTEIEPIQAYVDKGLFLCIGLFLLYISSKLSYVLQADN